VRTPLSQRPEWKSDGDCRYLEAVDWTAPGGHRSRFEVCREGSRYRYRWIEDGVEMSVHRSFFLDGLMDRAAANWALAAGVDRVVGFRVPPGLRGLRHGRSRR